MRVNFLVDLSAILSFHLPIRARHPNAICFCPLSDPLHIDDTPLFSSITLFKMKLRFNTYKKIAFQK